MQHFENVIFYILYNIFFLSFSIFEYLMYYLKQLKLQQKRMREKWSCCNGYKDAFEISAGCIYILFLLFFSFSLIFFFGVFLPFYILQNSAFQPSRGRLLYIHPVGWLVGWLSSRFVTINSTSIKPSVKVRNQTYYIFGECL